MKKERSKSEPVNGVLKDNSDDKWPEGYFEKYFGIFEDDPLVLPEELSWSLDAKREPLE